MKKSVILCVDDERIVLSSLKAELKENFGSQHIIELSEDPEEAIEILQDMINEGYEIPLIISDYIMPKMKGDELLKNIHKISPQTLSIMLTGQATTEGISNAVNWASLYRFIGKPWQSDDLSLTVREALKSYSQEKLLEQQNEDLKILNEELEKKVEIRTKEIQEKNIILQKQKDALNFQNQNITDSIKAAQKIQHAILPPEDLFTSLFPDHFIYFKPKDIVSGDFFWGKQKDELFYFAVADCTGHGVPGAFMSMLGISLLNDIVSSKINKQPNQVLCELRFRIKKLLHQNGSLHEAQDGMDIALCVFDSKSKQLTFAGAFNPLYLVRKNKQTHIPELHITKADRMPIGIYPKDVDPFTNHTIDLDIGDALYLFSDGYISQFGGSKGKKLRSSTFKNLLIDIHDLPMPQQKEKLDAAFVS